MYKKYIKKISTYLEKVTMQTEQPQALEGQLYSSGTWVRQLLRQLSGPNPQTRDQECQQISANLKENIQLNYQNTSMGTT